MLEAFPGLHLALDSAPRCNHLSTRLSATEPLNYMYIHVKVQYAGMLPCFGCVETSIFCMISFVSHIFVVRTVFEPVSRSIKSKLECQKDVHFKNQPG